MFLLVINVPVPETCLVTISVRASSYFFSIWMKICLTFQYPSNGLFFNRSLSLRIWFFFFSPLGEIRESYHAIYILQNPKSMREAQKLEVFRPHSCVCLEWGTSLSMGSPWRSSTATPACFIDRLAAPTAPSAITVLNVLIITAHGLGNA